MKLLILGGKGMAGNVMVHHFSNKPGYEVAYTSRDKHDQDSIYLDVTNSTSVEEVVEKVKPDILINCIGILNQFAADNPKLAFQVNSLLPHQLAKLVERYNGKLIHISTDCVFSGSKGDYIETDTPDGTSMYAQSKQLGEIMDGRHLTVRTSIIGPELKGDGIGLFQWFMQQSGQIKGYERAMWNGVTTIELAKAVDVFIQSGISGLYHLGADQKVSKYQLLMLFKEIFRKTDIEILRDSEFVQDRTIKSTRTDFYYRVPGYEAMLAEMKDWMEQNK